MIAEDRGDTRFIGSCAKLSFDNPVYRLQIITAGAFGTAELSNTTIWQNNNK